MSMILVLVALVLLSLEHGSVDHRARMLDDHDSYPSPSGPGLVAPGPARRAACGPSYGRDELELLG